MQIDNLGISETPDFRRIKLSLRWENKQFLIVASDFTWQLTRTPFVERQGVA
jgi:hypothetical protein